MSSTLPFRSQAKIESLLDVCGGRLCVEGTRIQVQDVCVWHELHRQTADENVSRSPQLTMADVYAALAYSGDHRDQIQRDMRTESDLVKRLRRRGEDFSTSAERWLISLTDEVHWQLVNAEQRVLVTNDSDLPSFHAQVRPHWSIADCYQQSRTIGQMIHAFDNI